MGQLILVRHGQASFFAANYDKLSPLGIEQAKSLGKFWVDHGIEFDAIFTGPKERQRHTAELVSESYSQAGLPFPEIVEIPGLDEHAADELLKANKESLAQSDPQIGELIRALDAAKSSRDKQRSFQLAFEAVVSRWIKGEIEADGIEPWLDFQKRVQASIQEIVAVPGRGKRVAGFSSVGPITIALQHALQCDDKIALDAGWRVKNCSLTSFLFSGERFTLDSFNGLPHIPEARLQSFR